MTALLQRFLNVRREEVAPILVAALYFFCVLTATQVLRSARDAIGMRGGLDEVRWLFVGTAVVTLGVNPIFGWLVSRFNRLIFISATYAFFALSLAGFYALITLAPAAVGEISGRVFYVWYSVFTLFSTMVFWALMADRFTPEQSKRLYGAIAVGGTLGAIFGPWLASVLVDPLGTAAMMLVSAGFLLTAIGAARAVAWLQPGQAQGPAPEASLNRAVIGGNAWAGIGAVLRSRYLLAISGYVLLMTIIGTFLYFTRLSMVAALGEDIDMRTGVFAQLDTITQSATLLLQLVLTGHIMKRFGVSVALMLLPLTAALGFIGLAAVGSFAVLVLFQAAYSAMQRAVARPARETLFTVVSREEKYKSKAFTDTFVYRGGDVVGAWTEGGLRALGLGLVGLASVALPLAVVWAGLGLWLGRQQTRLTQSRARAAERNEPGSAAAAPQSEPAG
jgi:AAA family ATP:ADP antiporter